MSDTSILPVAAGPDAGAALPGGPAPSFGEDAGGDRRRLLLIGGAVGVVLVGLVAYLLLHGGGSSGSSAASGVVPRGTPAAVAPPPGGASAASGGASHQAAKAGTTLPRKSRTSLARDPFKPLVVVATGGGAAASTTTVAPAAGAAPGTVPTTPAGGGTPAGAPAGSPVAIRLVRVEGDKSAVFDVTYRHGRVFRFDVVAPSPSSSQGTVFARDFALLGIQQNEATVQIGDDTPIDLRRGVTHSV